MRLVAPPNTGKADERRVRLVALVTTSVLLAATLMNLFLVVEGAPAVEPDRREGRTWHAEPDAAQHMGRHTWTFVIDGNGRQEIDLDVAVPFTTRITHVGGTATLTHRVSFLVDGAELDANTRVIEVTPQGNATERVSRTRVVDGDLGDRVRVSPEDPSRPFSLVVVWAWDAAFDNDDPEVVFRTEVHPLGVEAPDTGGLPGCGRDCALGLAVVAGIGQGAALFWWRRAGDGDHDRGP